MQELEALKNGSWNCVRNSLIAAAFASFASNLTLAQQIAVRRVLLQETNSLTASSNQKYDPAWTLKLKAPALIGTSASLSSMRSGTGGRTSPKLSPRVPAISEGSQVPSYSGVPSGSASVKSSTQTSPRSNDKRAISDSSRRRRQSIVGRPASGTQKQQQQQQQGEDSSKDSDSKDQLPKLFENCDLSHFLGMDEKLGSTELDDVLPCVLKAPATGKSLIRLALAVSCITYWPVVYDPCGLLMSWIQQELNGFANSPSSKDRPFHHSYRKPTAQISPLMRIPQARVVSSSCYAPNVVDIVKSAVAQGHLLVLHDLDERFWDDHRLFTLLRRKRNKTSQVLYESALVAKTYTFAIVHCFIHFCNYICSC